MGLKFTEDTVKILANSRQLADIRGSRLVTPKELFGGIVILVCGVQLILAVLSRLFKMYLCIPFGPVALSSFAGGHTISQTGISWIRTLLAYALEAVVIAIAIRISFGLFADGAVMSGSDTVSGAIGAILTIVEYCLPMITACACVKGAEATIRRCLGLG